MPELSQRNPLSLAILNALGIDTLTVDVVSVTFSGRPGSERIEVVFEEPRLDDPGEITRAVRAFVPVGQPQEVGSVRSIECHTVSQDAEQG